MTLTSCEFESNQSQSQQQRISLLYVCLGCWILHKCLSISTWPWIGFDRFYSYCIVAASAGVMYDWVLTFEQEVELIWRQRWSPITVLFLSVRYLGISYAVASMFMYVPTVPTTDTVSFILVILMNWIDIVANALLGVIMLIRLYAMYGRSRKVLIPLAVFLVAGNMFIGVAVATTIAMRDFSQEELILSGTHQCTGHFNGYYLHLDSVSWIFGTSWEVIALFLAVWIAVLHFCELRQRSGDGIMNDCFTVLIKTHLVYFASVVGVSCLGLGDNFSKALVNEYSLGTQIYQGLFVMFRFVQMFVLGPRLVLGVREYHAKLLNDSNTATGMTSIAFQEPVHISTRSSV
ncbi:uncharacterized protein EDB93DRAFT_1327217 [Suillus bovinus]|uniref:uncharacterized protein n=1 Tax=Suillus bovinus TaxID=48563 RepID=UPI001B866814|nr:uncharacterized protein EDB93DRAFT_1327217 [Suillus bovinus]KAG2153706.1 hypothetical protein EDB93DRAFT_1327217 [Suillus bovinus]